MGQLSATTNGSSTSTISLSSLASLFSKSANYEFKTNADGALQFNLVDIHADRLLSRVRKCHLHPVWLSVPRDNESNDERRIACVHVQAHHHPRFTFLCSHGGTTTLGNIQPVAHLSCLCWLFFNFFLFDTLQIALDAQVTTLTITLRWPNWPDAMCWPTITLASDWAKVVWTANAVCCMMPNKCIDMRLNNLASEHVTSFYMDKV